MKWLWGFTLFCSALFAKDLKLTALLSSLDPLSVRQHLAFYELYGETEEGQKALKRAWSLLSHGSNEAPMMLPLVGIQGIISIVTRQPFDTPVQISQEQLKAIEDLSQGLKNRKLKGHSVWSEQDIHALDPGEIDLARAILIHQFNGNQDYILQYEASLDLMALQILARLPEKASPELMIQEINRFIFEEMQFRFPPHSLYAKDIDLYTFLSSVMDSREGVCLGVSILYLCLAQRLDLPLEIITPPGHIFVRYRSGVKVINIETTARGINMPSETYLGIDTRRLQERHLKEVVGLSFMNQAAVAWERDNPEEVVRLYEKALPYLPGDPLIQMFLGINELFIGRTREGKKRLEAIKHITFDHAVSAETLPADYLDGRIDAKGIRAIFLHVDEKRSSVVEKQKEIEALIKKFPRFRAGIFHLAVCHLQLGRVKEAKEALEKYHRLDPTNATVEYYLSIVSMERFDWMQAWRYLKITEKILEEREHKCRALRELKTELRKSCPEIS
jgi:tetratricopeptide (TPR) repeat protein